MERADIHAAASADWVARVHPSRIIALFAPADLSAETALRMRAHPRLKARLATMLDDDAAAGDVSPSAGSAEPLPWDADTSRLVRVVGAIWHGRALRGILSGPALAELAALIGEEAMIAGVKHADDGIAPAAVLTAHEIAEAVGRDGAAAVAAWLEAENPGRVAGYLLELPQATADVARGTTDEHRTAALRLVPLALSVIGDQPEEAAR